MFNKAKSLAKLAFQLTRVYYLDYNKANKLSSLTLALNNNTAIITEQMNTTVFHNRAIEILNDDCLVSILSYLNKTEDLASCKNINKRFYYLIKDRNLFEKLFFIKYYLQHPTCLLLPQRYLASVNNKLTLSPKVIASNNNYSNQAEKNIFLKKKTLISIEKNLAQAHTLNLKSITSINHTNTINSIAFSKDNTFFATASNDNSAKVYQFINGNWEQLYELVHSDGIKDIIFSPNNRYIITSSNLMHRIWKISTKKYNEITSFKNYSVAKIYFRDDSKRLFIKFNHSPIKILDLIDDTCNCILTIKEPEIENFFNVRQGCFIENSFLPNSIKNDTWLSFIMKRYVLISMINGSTYNDSNLASTLKDIVHGTRWRELKFYDHLGLESIIYSDDMRLLYGMPTNASAVIFEYNNNKWQLKLKFSGGEVASCFSSDNKRIITSSSYSEKNIHETTIWNISGNTAYRELVLSDTFLADFSKDGKYFIASHFKKKVSIWQFIDNSWRIKLFIKNEHSIYNICFSNYNWILAIASNKVVNILEVTNSSKKIINSSDTYPNKPIKFNEIENITQADNIFFSPYSNYFITTNNMLAQIWRIDTDNSKVIETLYHEENITNILFIPNNSHIIISSGSYNVIWGITENKYSKKFIFNTQEKPYIDFKDDGTKILIAAKNLPVRILNLVNDNWQQEFLIKIEDALVIQENKFTLMPLLQQSNDNDWLLNSLQKYVIRETSQDKNKNNFTSMFEDRSTFNLFGNDNSPSNTFGDRLPLISTSVKESMVNIIYTKSHKAYVSSFNLLTSDIISYSQDKKLIYLGFRNDNCVVLENNNNQWQKKIIFNGGTSQACFSADNQRIITISNTRKNPMNRMIVWNIATEIAYQELGLNNISSAVFSPDNQYLAIASTADKKVEIWSLIEDHWKIKIFILSETIPCNVSFSADSRFISVVYDDKTVKIYAIKPEI